MKYSVILGLASLLVSAYSAPTDQDVVFDGQWSEEEGVVSGLFNGEHDLIHQVHQMSSASVLVDLDTLVITEYLPELSERDNSQPTINQKNGSSVIQTAISSSGSGWSNGTYNVGGCYYYGDGPQSGVILGGSYTLNYEYNGTIPFKTLKKLLTPPNGFKLTQKDTQSSVGSCTVTTSDWVVNPVANRWVQWFETMTRTCDSNLQNCGNWEAVPGQSEVGLTAKNTGLLQISCLTNNNTTFCSH